MLLSIPDISIRSHLSEIEPGTAVIVLAGAHHNIKITGVKPLKLYTV